MEVKEAMMMRRRKRRRRGSGKSFFNQDIRESGAGMLKASEGGPSEALGLLQEAGLGGQRHQGRGQAPEAHPGPEAELGGGQ